MAKGASAEERKKRDKGRVGSLLCSLLEINGADFAATIRSVGSSRPSSTLPSTLLSPTTSHIPSSEREKGYWKYFDIQIFTNLDIWTSWPSSSFASTDHGSCLCQPFAEEHMYERESSTRRKYIKNRSSLKSCLRRKDDKYDVWFHRLWTSFPFVWGKWLHYSLWWCFCAVLLFVWEKKLFPVKMWYSLWKCFYSSVGGKCLQAVGG